MIPQMESDLNIIQQLDDYPNDVGGLTPDELKHKFDESGLTIKEFLNGVLIPALIAANIPFERTTAVPADTVRAAILNVQQQAASAAAGTIPNGSISNLKLTTELNAFLSLLRTDATNTDIKAEQNRENIQTLSQQHGQDIQALQDGLSLLSADVSENYEHFTGEVSRLDESISSLDESLIETDRKVQTLDSISESVLWNSAIGLLAAAHAGQNTSMSERAYVDALKNDKKTSANTNLAFGDTGASLLTNGYSGKSGTVLIDVDTSDTEICRVTPNGYGNATMFNISGAQYMAGNTTLTLSVYSGSNKLTEKSVSFNPSSQGFSQDFRISLLLHPKTEYTFKMKRSFSSDHNTSIQIHNWTLNAVPTTYNSGNFETKDIAIPENTQKIRIMCRASTQSHTIYSSINGDAYSALTLDKKTDENVAISTAIKTVQSGNERIKLKFELNGRGESIHDYAIVFI